METADVTRDERTIAVENAACRLGYMVLLFGVMADVVYRGLIKFGAMPDVLSLADSNWDLMGLVLLSSVISLAYQATHGTLGQFFSDRRTFATVTAIIFAQVIAAWFLTGWLIRQG